VFRYARLLFDLTAAFRKAKAQSARRHTAEHKNPSAAGCLARLASARSRDVFIFILKRLGMRGQAFL